MNRPPAGVFASVTGAWLGAWARDEVAAELRATGHEVHTLTLSGRAGKKELPAGGRSARRLPQRPHDLTGEQTARLIGEGTPHPAATPSEPAVLKRPAAGIPDEAATRR